MMVLTMEPGRMEKKNNNTHTQTSYLVMALSLSLFLFALVVLLVETIWTSKRISKKENITPKIFCGKKG